MGMKRQQSNIVNLGFTITTDDGKAGVEVNQAIVNGTSAGVSMRTINGARKSAAVQLDLEVIADLQTALSEILASAETC